MPPTTAQQGVNHCAAFSSFWMANEQKILFPKSTGPNRVFDEVIVDLQRTVLSISNVAIRAPTMFS